MLAARTEPRVSVGAEGIYLNNKKFIDKKAELQFMIFSVLLHNFSDSVIECRVANYVSNREINAHLRKRGLFLNDHEAQIRKAIYKIRKSAKKQFDIEIIEAESWKGYRINPRIFMGRNTKGNVFFGEGTEFRRKFMHTFHRF